MTKVEITELRAEIDRIATPLAFLCLVWLYTERGPLTRHEVHSGVNASMNAVQYARG